jgi:hypothetical protein
MRRHAGQRLIAGHGAGDDDFVARVLHGIAPGVGDHPIRVQTLQIASNSNGGWVAYFLWLFI